MLSTDNGELRVRIVPKFLVGSNQLDNDDDNEDSTDYEVCEYSKPASSSSLQSHVSSGTKTAAPLSVDVSQMCSPLVLRPSQMIKLGQVIDNIKPANKQWKISLQSFDTIAMNWVQPKTYHCSFEAKSFAQGAFREVYAAKINDDLFAKKRWFSRNTYQQRWQQ